MLVVWLLPYTTLSSCPSWQYLDWAGECVNCQDLEVCQARLAGCPALEQSSECVVCTEGVSQVALDGEHRVQSNESICAWECCQEFFLVEWGCVNCSTQGLACPPGQGWQACSERADAGCTACQDEGLLRGQQTVGKETRVRVRMQCRLPQ